MIELLAFLTVALLPILAVAADSDFAAFLVIALCKLVLLQLRCRQLDLKIERPSELMPFFRLRRYKIGLALVLPPTAGLAIVQALTAPPFLFSSSSCNCATQVYDVIAQTLTAVLVIAPPQLGLAIVQSPTALLLFL